jgi:hypothetical protein
MMNWKGCGRKRSWTNFKISKNLLGETEENNEHLSQDSRFPGRDFEPVTSRIWSRNDNHWTAMFSNFYVGVHVIMNRKLSFVENAEVSFWRGLYTGTNEVMRKQEIVIIMTKKYSTHGESGFHLRDSWLLKGLHGAIDIDKEVKMY